MLKGGSHFIRVYQKTPFADAALQLDSKRVHLASLSLIS